MGVLAFSCNQNAAAAAEKRNLYLVLSSEKPQPQRHCGGCVSLLEKINHGASYIQRQTEASTRPKSPELFIDSGSIGQLTPDIRRSKYKQQMG